MLKLKLKRLFYRYSCCLQIPITAVPRTFKGKTLDARVISVYDGDTITIVTRMSRREPYYSYKLRLANIDTPELHPKLATANLELHRKAGAKVAEFVRTMLLNKIITVTFQQEDKFGRLLGTVSNNGTDVSTHLINRGYALMYDGGRKAEFSEAFLRNILAQQA